MTIEVVGERILTDIVVCLICSDPVPETILHKLKAENWCRMLDNAAVFRVISQSLFGPVTYPTRVGRNGFSGGVVDSIVARNAVGFPIDP